LTQRNARGRWSLLAAVSLAAVLLYFAFRGVNWREILATVRQARPEFLALAACVGSASYFVRGLRWRILLSAEKPLARMTAFWATMTGYLGNNYLPARAGEVVRSVLVGRGAGLSQSFALATALTERMLDAITLVLIGLAAVMALPDLPDWLLSAVRVMGIVGLAGLVMVLAATRLESLLKRILLWLLPGAWHARLVGLLERFLMGMRAFQHPGRALGFILFSMVIWLADALTATVVARAMSLTLSLPQAFLLLVALGLASAAPSTPGYMGIYQFVAATVLPPFGFSRSEALAYILVAQAITYGVVTVWGLLGLWRLGASEARKAESITDAQVERTR
jgi:uncharacterized protein (TIRG00374 family)